MVYLLSLYQGPDHFYSLAAVHHVQDSPLSMALFIRLDSSSSILHLVVLVPGLYPMALEWEDLLLVKPKLAPLPARHLFANLTGFRREPTQKWSIKTSSYISTSTLT